MSINLTLKATGSCPYWAFFDPSAISNLLLVDENHILDHFPDYLAQLRVACDSHKVILLHPSGDPHVLVVAGESIDEILREGRYQQLLAGSFVVLPGGSLICSVVNKMATISNDDNSRAQTIKPGIYEVAAFRRSSELIDAHLCAEIGQDDLSFFERVQKLTRLGCLLTLGAPVLGFGFFAATLLGFDATVVKSGLALTAIRRDLLEPDGNCSAIESLAGRHLEAKSIASEIPRAHHFARAVRSVGRAARRCQSVH